MSGELDSTNDISSPLQEPVKKRWRPVPVLDEYGRPVIAGYRSRIPSSGYIRKDILNEIDQNLTQLSDIRSDQFKDQITEQVKDELKKDLGLNIKTNPNPDQFDTVEPKINQADIEKSIDSINPIDQLKIEIPTPTKSDPKIPTPTQNSDQNQNQSDKNKNKIIQSQSQLSQSQIQPAIKPDIKIDKIIKKIDNKKILKTKINSLKVLKMNDEQQQIVQPYIIKEKDDPELKKLAEKARHEEYKREEFLEDTLRKLIHDHENDRRKLEELETFQKDTSSKLDKYQSNNQSNYENFNKELKSFDTNITNKFDVAQKKVEESCIGIECLKTDVKKLEPISQEIKKLNLLPCPHCKQTIVPKWPQPASFCPNCSGEIKYKKGTTPVGWIHYNDRNK